MILCSNQPKNGCFILIIEANGNYRTMRRYCHSNSKSAPSRISTFTSSCVGKLCLESGQLENMDAKNKLVNNYNELSLLDDE